MSQVDWDEVNAEAESRKSRALELLADLPATLIQKPEREKQRSKTSASFSGGSFAGPSQILKRARNLGIFSHLSAVPDNPYRPWDGPVDWSECVARDIPDFNDLSGESQLVIELRERGIDLRNDNDVITPACAISLARARRRGILA